MRAFFYGPALGGVIAVSLAVACGDEPSGTVFRSNTGGVAGDSGTMLASGGTVISETGGSPGTTGGAGGVPVGGSGGGGSGAGGRSKDAAAEASPETGVGGGRDAAPPVGCQASVDCPAGAPVCHVATGLCTACNSSAQCPPTEECVGGGCTPLKTCTNSIACAGNTDGRTICDQQNGVCVECNADADCSLVKTCSNHRCLTRCTTDNQCTSAGLLCNPSLGVCTECVQTSDCPAASYCDSGSCVPDTCVAGARTCSGNAVYECNTTGSAVSLIESCGRQTCTVGDAGAMCPSPPPGTGGAPGTGGGSSTDAGLPAHCSNGVRDADETDVNCGGADCARCVAGDSCARATDCATLSCGPSCILPICQLARVCLQPTCTDGVKNGDETGPDCGGPTCGKCPGGEPCKVNTDCTSNACTGGTCDAPKCVASACPTCSFAVKCCTAQDTCGCIPVRGGTCN